MNRSYAEMTDLSFSIEGQEPEAIAKYFEVKTDWVRGAIMEGAKTYQDVWNYIQECEDNDVAERLIRSTEG